jgi:hypothetical protein
MPARTLDDFFAGFFWAGMKSNKEMKKTLINQGSYARKKDK